MIVTSLGCCCRHSGECPQNLDCCSSCNVQGKIGDGEMKDDMGMVKAVEGVFNLGAREMLVARGQGFQFVWWWLC